MRLEKALLVFKKDFIEISRNKEVLLPMLIIPIIFAFLLPAISVMAPDSVNTGGDTDTLVATILANLPENVQTMLMGLSANQQVIYVMLV
ncbi:hypothetical protein MUP51_06565, partial [Candidatus Bathyarchaeota archaeon]|nr:hypothetical protein [Candidatus Bathyarchaeota archaeon]